MLSVATGGLLALKPLSSVLVSPEAVYHEVEGNLLAILLLVFMVAGIYFGEGPLLFVFSKYC